MRISERRHFAPFQAIGPDRKASPKTKSRPRNFRGRLVEIDSQFVIFNLPIVRVAPDVKAR